MPEDRVAKIAFLGGVATTSVVMLLVLVLVGWRGGYRRLFQEKAAVVLPAEVPEDDRLPAPPVGLLPELVRLGAVFDNAENLTAVHDHDSFLVRPDARRIYVLRPNARVDAYLLATRRALNLDPPVLYFPAGAAKSDALRRYLEQHTRLQYRFTVDARGFRRTVPEVESARKVLMVGDSVLFGVGIDDEGTMASALQGLVGAGVQIVNAGVGEYGAEEIYRTADALSADAAYEALVYVACQNDFPNESGEQYLASASQMLERLSGLAPRFHGRVAVFLVTVMEYNLFDVLQERGWSREDNQRTDFLRRGLPVVARRLGFAYRDWSEPVARLPRQDGTLFSRFALYADHVHLSPEGNRMAARELHPVLDGWGLGGR